MGEFERHYDPDLGCVVTSERHRERVMQEKGLGDVRDWESRENMLKVAAKNFEEARAKENAYIADPVARALQAAARGETPDEFIPELEARLEEESAKIDRQLESRAQENRERQQEERERWERDNRDRR